MVIPPKLVVMFVVDTDSYAGNFERKMTAYMTGQYGECEIGENESSLFEKEYPSEFKDIGSYILILPDDNGCYRPCSIFPSDNGKYNSFAIYFEKFPSKYQELFVDRAKEYAKNNNIKIKSFRLIERRVMVTDDTILTITE
ncbi:MAG: hypothetical protein ACOC33_02550 [bacterium]